MSLWNCPKCGTLTGPEYGPCPRCGEMTTHYNPRIVEDESVLRERAEGEKGFEEWYTGPVSEMLMRQETITDVAEKAYHAGRASRDAEVTSLKTRSAGDHDIIFNEHDLACCKRCHGGEVELVESCAERLAAEVERLRAELSALTNASLFRHSELQAQLAALVERAKEQTT